MVNMDKKGAGGSEGFLKSQGERAETNMELPFLQLLDKQAR